MRFQKYLVDSTSKLYQELYSSWGYLRSFVIGLSWNLSWGFFLEFLVGLYTGHNFQNRFSVWQSGFHFQNRFWVAEISFGFESIVVGVTGAVLSLAFPGILVGDFSWNLLWIEFSKPDLTLRFGF